jgi:hypothetical protein
VADQTQLITGRHFRRLENDSGDPGRQRQRSVQLPRVPWPQEQRKREQPAGTAGSVALISNSMSRRQKRGVSGVPRGQFGSNARALAMSDRCSTKNGGEVTPLDPATPQSRNSSSQVTNRLLDSDLLSVLEPGRFVKLCEYATPRVRSQTSGSGGEVNASPLLADG